MIYISEERFLSAQLCWSVLTILPYLLFISQVASECAFVTCPIMEKFHLGVFQQAILRVKNMLSVLTGSSSFDFGGS